MQRLSSELTNDVHFYMSGNVTIHPTAAIAPGVFLQADPGSQLIIEAGVSIGTGSVLHVRQGILEIKRDVTIGSQVLVFGRGVIGEQSCIGSMATLISDVDIRDEQVVASATLLDNFGQANAHVEDGVQNRVKPTSTTPGESVNGQSISEGSPQGSASASPQQRPSASNSSTKFAHVYGRSSVERLMQMMFQPSAFSQTMNGSSSPTQPADDDGSIQ